MYPCSLISLYYALWVAKDQKLLYTNSEVSPSWRTFMQAEQLCIQYLEKKSQHRVKICAQHNTGWRFVHSITCWNFLISLTPDSSKAAVLVVFEFCMVLSVLMNSKFGVFYSSFLSRTQLFAVSIEMFSKTPNFSGRQHFYSYFQNPSENFATGPFLLSYSLVTVFQPCHEKPCFSHMRTTNVQISLCIRAVWSAPLLFATETV